MTTTHFSEALSKENGMNKKNDDIAAIVEGGEDSVDEVGAT